MPQNYEDDNPYASPQFDPKVPIDQIAPTIGATIAARIDVSPRYYLEATKRFRSQRKGRHIWLAFRIAAIAFFALMAGFGAWAGGFVFAGMLAIFALVLIFAQQLENWLLVRKLKATPQIYGEVVILLSNEDYFAQSNAQETRLNWSVFTRALHFEDGFLLFQGPRLYHWLPFAALVNPSQIAELESLLRSKIFDYSDHRKKNSRTLSNGGKV